MVAAITAAAMPEAAAIMVGAAAIAAAAVATTVAAAATTAAVGMSAGAATSAAAAAAAIRPASRVAARPVVPARAGMTGPPHQRSTSRVALRTRRSGFRGLNLHASR